MKVPGIKTAKRFSRWAQARILGGALILGYHRITNLSRDDHGICVSPEHFSEHLDVLRKYTNVIALSQLVQHLKAGSLPPRSVAVTFDDGYADNLYEAKPLLENYQVPATIFVCTESLGKTFWWDELSWLINYPASLPEDMHLNLTSTPFEWHSAKSSRSELITLLHLELFSLEETERSAAMAKIREWSSAPSFDTSSQRALTFDELLQLAESPIIEIGSHSRTHPTLPRLSVQKQKAEIETSRKYLEELLGRPIDGFSYPNGIFSNQTRNLVQEAGYTYACMSDSGLARNMDHVYQLPRLWPRDWEGKQFLQFLKRWLPR